ARADLDVSETRNRVLDDENGGPFPFLDDGGGRGTDHGLLPVEIHPARYARFDPAAWIGHLDDDRHNAFMDIALGQNMPDLSMERWGGRAVKNNLGLLTGVHIIDPLHGDFGGDVQRIELQDFGEGVAALDLDARHNADRIQEPVKRALDLRPLQI